MRKLRPPPRPFIDPPMPHRSLEYHAYLLARRRTREGAEIAPRPDALAAAAYAIAAFDPRNVLEAWAIGSAFSHLRLADTFPDPVYAARLRKSSADSLRELARLQSEPQGGARPRLNDDPAPDIGLGSTLDARAWGFTPWRELIRDPALRRRLAD